MHNNLTQNMEFQAGGIHWNVSQFGQGPQYLIAFHGYGQDAQAFKHFSEISSDTYSILSIDLAFHGKHEDFPKGFLFNREYADIWLNALLKAIGQKTIGLIGYSIGGRIAMSMLEWFPNRISELILFAPDGLPVPKTYIFLTRTLLGQWIFKGFINSPRIAFSLIMMGEKLKVLSMKVADFYRTEILDASKRQQLFDTWMAYRSAVPSNNRLNKQLKGNSKHVMCILGLRDAVIKHAITRKHARKRFPDLKLIELDLGHNLLSNKSIKHLSSYWNK